MSERSQAGFTLVELLTAILIVGILAAIAIPSFLAQREKATDAGAQKAVTTARIAMRVWETQTGEFNARPKDLVGIEPALKNALSLKTGQGTDSFWVQVASSTGNVFRVTRASSGVRTQDCGQSKVGRQRGRAGCHASPDAAGNYW